jgi:hypothetical protein
MKHLFSLLALFIAMQLNGQIDYQSAQKFVRDAARYWANPQNVEQLTTRGATTHTLDSIVLLNGASVVIEKAEMEYNDEGLTTIMRQYLIDSLTGSLLLDGITTFAYQGGNLSNLSIQELNPETQEFEVFAEMDFQYDGSNRLDSAVISLEDPFFGGGFGPFLGIKNVYSGDLLVQTRQWLFVALLGGWIPSSVTDFEYDNNDLLIDQLTSAVDFTTGDVVPSTRTTYAYNAQGLQETVIDYTWVDPNWEESLRNTFEYHSNGTLFNQVEEVFSNGAWVNSVWTTYPIANVTEEYPFSSYVWDAVTSAWIVSDSTINLLNPALPWDQVAAPTQLTAIALLGGETSGAGLFDFEGSSIDESRYFIADSLTQELGLDSRQLYYYSLIEGSAVNPVLPEYLMVSPNPAQDQFYIDLDIDTKATYKVYNGAGATVARGEMNIGRNAVQTTSWTPGIYYVTIHLNDGSVYVHKQMVE